jgi:hypothetical protein
MLVCNKGKGRQNRLIAHLTPGVHRTSTVGKTAENVGSEASTRSKQNFMTAI